MMRRAELSAAAKARREQGRERRHRGGGRLPLEAEREIRRLCMGYAHRARRIGEGRLPPAILADMRRTNELLDDALAEVAEPQLAALLLEDLADRRGVMYTQAYWIGETTYKRRKRAAKHAIAKRFSLVGKD